MEQKGPTGGGAGYVKVRPFCLETEVKSKYAGRRGRDSVCHGGTRGLCWTAPICAVGTGGAQEAPWSFEMAVEDVGGASLSFRLSLFSLCLQPGL